MNFNDLKNEFSDPGPEWRPMPFWFWNSKLKPREIERQVHLMSEAGLGGFFMHARFGLETEYMGEDWMICTRRAVQAAHECGLQAWLYDEYPFPSGVGGLEVTGNLEYCNKFIDLVEEAFTGPRDISLSLPEGEAILAYAVPINQVKPFQESAIPINSIEDQHLCWSVPEGEWLVMIFILRTLQDPRGNVFGPDYLNPEMTAAFLKVLDGYIDDEELRKYLGGTIPGIFTDEPCLLSWHQNHTSYRVRHNGRIAVWGDQIPERLMEQGYDWKIVIPAIFFNTGEESANLRHAYRQAVADSYIENFFMPYKQWCDRHNLSLTGHLLLEEGLYTNTIFQGDFIRDLGIFDIPGTDHLGIGCENEYGGWGNLPLMSTNVQGQKLVSSIAHLYGKKAVLSESFGVSGWGLALSDMKRIVDWQYRLGISFLCPHAFYYSMEGFRKYDSPPSQFFQATYWPYYKYFSDYVGRLSLLMRAGDHVARAALLYPQDAFWKAYKAGKEDSLDRSLADQFDFYASGLPKCHIDYDIVPASFIKADSVNGGTLRINNEKYELIILPAVPCLSSDLINTLSIFYQQGGKLLLSAPVMGDLLKSLQKLPSPHGKYSILGGMDLETVKSALEKMLVPHVDISHREVTYIHRDIGGKHIYFLASDSNKSLKAHIKLRNTGKIEQWNLETGEIQEIMAEIRQDEFLHIDWSFAPHGSVVFVVDTNKPLTRIEPALTPKLCDIKIKNAWEFECLSPNAMILDNWRTKLTTQGDWLHYDYFADFQMGFIPENIQLLLDDVESRGSFMEGMYFKIFINEHEISVKSSNHYVDPKWKTFDIADRLQQGRNKIQIRFTNQSWAGEPKAMTIPPKLLGNFSLKSDGNNGYIIAPPVLEIPAKTSWTEYGYPFYSGSAVYTQQIEISKEMLSSKQIWVEVTDVADMVEFIVNDACAEVRPWSPYGCDIRPFVHLGMNKISLKVTNSMQNFLEGTPKPSGLIGFVRMANLL